MVSIPTEKQIKYIFFGMFYNVFNVIQRGNSYVLEHNNVKSAKSNATPQIHIFII